MENYFLNEYNIPSIMIKENLIFKLSLFMSVTAHVCGFGLLHGNSANAPNNIVLISNNSVVIYEIGWVEQEQAIQSIQKKEKVSENDLISPYLNNEERHSEEISIKKSISRESKLTGSSGHAAKNIGNGVVDEYLILVRKRIEMYKYYPKHARKRLQQGNVIINFYIDKNGIPKDIKVVKTSGYSLLDNACKEIVLKANPFPKPPIESYIQTNIVFEL